MSINSQNKLICSQSAWGLDADTAFLTDEITVACDCPSDGVSSDPGELQNPYTTVTSNLFDQYPDGASFTPDLTKCTWTGSWISSGFTSLGSPGSGPVYNRRHTMLSLYSFNQPSGMEIPQVMKMWNDLQLDIENPGTTPPEDPFGAPASWYFSYYPLGKPQLFGGTALFESPRLANCEASYQFLGSSSTQGLESGLKFPDPPSYNSYAFYSEDLRTKNRDYSVLPEFRISQWLEYYLIEKGGNFLSINPGQFDIFGMTGSQKETWISGEGNEAIEVSGDDINNSSKNNFYKIFSNSDFMKHYPRLRSDHQDFVESTTITLTCKALLKLLPYDGFYPADRTLQISHLMSQSFGDNIQIYADEPNSTMETWFSGSQAILGGPPGLDLLRRPFYSAMMSPGLLFNSIKAGMAVDYPILGRGASLTDTGHTRSRPPDIVAYQLDMMVSGTAGCPVDWCVETGLGNPITSVFAMGLGEWPPQFDGMTERFGFQYRVPFEALLEPENYLKNLCIVGMEPHPDASYNYGQMGGLQYPYDNSGLFYPGAAAPRWWKHLVNAWNGESKSPLYNRAINNFLAEVAEFFLPEGKFTTLKSGHSNAFKPVVAGKTYAMRVKLRRTLDSPRSWTTVGLGQDGLPVIDFELPQDPIVFNGVYRDLFMGASGSRLNTKENFTLYSRPSAFGPPCAGTGSFSHGVIPGDSGGPFSGSQAMSMSFAIGMRPSDATTGFYCPFTPGYKDGEAWADIVFVPIATGIPTFEDIKENCVVNLWRVDGVGQITDTNIGGILTDAGQLAETTGDTAYQGDVQKNAFWNAHSSSGQGMFPLDIQCVNAHSMQLDASINLFGFQDERWVIQPKFETPHYNFNNLESSVGYEPIDPSISSFFSESYTVPATNTISIPLHASESVPRGMWHQFGTIESEKGIYLEITDIPDTWMWNRGSFFPDGIPFNPSARQVDTPYKDYASITNIVDQGTYNNVMFNTTRHTIESLANILDFEKSTKLGNTAVNKVIKEAVVAVPFIEEEGQRKFFEIPENVIRIALGDLGQTTAASEATAAAAAAAQAAIDSLQDQLTANNVTEAQVGAAASRAAAHASAEVLTGVKGMIPNQTIIDMVDKMKKYIFPPRMDFIKYIGKIRPFAMYIFEFEYTLSQCELSKIWQNVLPDIGQKMVEQQVSISHELLSHELMGNFEGTTPEAMKDRVQWMVFKVKTRANNNYFSKVIKNSDETEKIKQYDYSYNWPYDYFSLVECAKMEAEVGFGTETDENKEAVEFKQYGGAPVLETGVRATKPLLRPADQNRSQTNSQSPSERAEDNKEKRKEDRQERNKKGAFGETKKK